MTLMSQDELCAPCVRVLRPTRTGHSEAARTEEAAPERRAAVVTLDAHNPNGTNPRRGFLLLRSCLIFPLDRTGHLPAHYGTQRRQRRRLR